MLIAKPEGRGPFGRRRRRWKRSTKLFPKMWGVKGCGLDLTGSQDRAQCRLLSKR